MCQNNRNIVEINLGEFYGPLLSLLILVLARLFYPQRQVDIVNMVPKSHPIVKLYYKLLISYKTQVDYMYMFTKN